MSLSKYYQNTKGFQQKKLVQEEAPREKKWKPLSIQPNPEFIPQSIQHTDSTHTKEPQQETVSPTPSPEPDSTLEQMGQTHLSPPSYHLPEKELPPEEQPSQRKVDLNEYVKISEAQTQIDVAYQEGFDAGIKQIENDYDSATKALYNACYQLNNLQETIIKNSSREMQEFALAIADRILRFSVTQQDKTIIATIEEALHQATRSEEFTIHLNPEDMNTVKEKSAEIVANISGLENIILKSDPTVERGGARMESENCTIDATITSQFEVIRNEIINEY